MTVNLQINGTALSPQPRSATWELANQGGKLNGTDHIGSYDTLVLRSPPSRGGTANWNWAQLENQVLTSIVAMPRGQTLRNGTETTYNSGVVSKPISPISTEPGDIVTEVEFRVLVIT
jgi:hypothetical protein